MYTAKVQGGAKVLDNRHVGPAGAPRRPLYIYMHRFYK